MNNDRARFFAEESWTGGVIGLGYVGLPLAVALARHFDTVGFDVNPARVAMLRDGEDGTGEVDSGTLADSALALSSDVTAMLKSPSDC